jgi:hypothetical protein
MGSLIHYRDDEIHWLNSLEEEIRDQQKARLADHTKVVQDLNQHLSAWYVLHGLRRKPQTQRAKTFWM